MIVAANVVRTWAQEHKELLFTLGGVSLATLVISAFALPFIVSRMRADYFLPNRDESRSFAHLHPVLRWTGLILKNFLGGVLFIAGVLMLGLPGQGILTILIGLMLIDFPGKQRLELWLVRLPAVEHALNWIRKKGDRPPLEIPPKVSSAAEGSDSSAAQK